MTAADALRLIEQGENQEVEFKHALRDAASAARVLAALANTRGGTLLVGVDDRLRVPADPGAAVVGLDDVVAARRLVERAAGKVLALPALGLDAVTVEGKQLLAVQVPAAAEPVVGPKGVQVRAADGATKVMSPEQLKRALLAPRRGTTEDLAAVVVDINRRLAEQAERAERAEAHMVQFQAQVRASDERAREAEQERRRLQRASDEAAAGHYRETLLAVRDTSKQVRAGGRLRAQWKPLLVGAVLGGLVGLGFTGLGDLLV